MLLYTDLSFWLVFVVFLSVFAIVRRCSRVGMLLYVAACSCAYYWLANGWLLLLLLGMALISWWTGRVLGSQATQPCSSGVSRLRRATLTAAIVLLLFPLLYFKYTTFLLSSFNAILSSHFSVRSMMLPVGVSFFTFQAISYLVDSYRGRFRMRVTFLEFLFYLSFFPLLLAGPITRAGTLLPQVRKAKGISSYRLYAGVWLMMLGLLKKCVIADYIAQYNDWIFDDPLMYSGFECLMGIVGYTVQIYCDFSGYSDMSIGLAAMMGFRLVDNFSFPYRATNLSQFWRRWHISLSTWFRDYLYIPLGGNRCSRVRTYINNIITMLVAGLWHGASWMFVLWGGIHGLGLVVQKACHPLLKHIPDNRFFNSVCVVFTLVYVAIAWVFFRSGSVDSALLVLSRSVSDFDIAYLLPFVNARPWWCVLVLIPLLAQFISDSGYNRIQARYIRLPWLVKAILLLIVLQLVLQFRTSNVQPFIYSQF